MCIEIDERILKKMCQIEHFKKIFTVCVVCITLVMTGCTTTHSESKDEQYSEGNFVIPENGSIGGYELESDNMYCMAVTDGLCEYVKYESKSGNHVIEYYASQTETIIIDHMESETTYYRETFDKEKEVYPNPLQNAYDELRELEFEQMPEYESEEWNVFQATQISQVMNQEQIDYTKYQIEMTWTDGKIYNYSYYQYADGATLISAEAPDEINDLLTPDTKWVIDIGRLCIENKETNQEVSIQIVGTTTGQALSPNGGTSTTEETTYIRVYADKENGKIMRLQYSKKDSATETSINVLQEAEISKPEITGDMTEMDNETLQMAFMLIGVMQSLF